MEKPRSWPRSPAVTAEGLPNVFAVRRVVVIHCWAEWNGYDMWLDATIDSIRGQYEDRVAFYALDVDLVDNHAFCAQHGVLNVPALVCFINGKWHETSIWNLARPRLEAKLQDWIEKAGHV
jgi:thiol-disulfide isomerase/thioredoxin